MNKTSHDELNCEFYNTSEESFDKIPFDTLITDLLTKYQIGKHVLEIGSGAGALAAWLTAQGVDVTCVEPAQALAQKAVERGLKVYPTTLQSFIPDRAYNSVIAISSLIHIPKAELPVQLEKIADMLTGTGYCIVSFIEGVGEGLEDPTQIGKMRYFARWNESELNELFSPRFSLLETHQRFVKRMDCTFIISVYQKRE